MDIRAVSEPKNQRNIFHAIKNSIRNSRTFAENNLRLKLLKEKLIHHLGAEGEVVSYPFQKFKSASELNLLGKNAILEGHILFLIAKRKNYISTIQKEDITIT